MPRISKICRLIELSALVLTLMAGCYSYPLLEDVQQESDYTYKIGVGDNLTIFVWGNPELSESATVRPDGKISFPLVEELLAQGKTPFQLARDIEKILGIYVKTPQVVVMAHNFKGVKNQQIRVIGRIGGGAGNSNNNNRSTSSSSANPGSGGGSGGSSGNSGGTSGGIGRYQGKTIPYERGMTLLDVIIQIGLNQYADGNRSTVIRNVNGEPTRYAVRIDDLIDDADLTANVLMMPGDILIIPDALF